MVLFNYHIFFSIYFLFLVFMSFVLFSVNSSMMDSLDMDGNNRFSVSESMERSSDYKENGNFGKDLAFNEEILLDDLDSYLDDLHARLTVSRMVSDSVIKGMVNAVMEESTERIGMKELEVVRLNERLHSCESDRTSVKSETLLPIVTKVEGETPKLDSNFMEQLVKLRLAANEKVQSLKEGVGDLRNANIPQGSAMDKLQELDGFVDALQAIVASLCEQNDDMFRSLKTSACEQQWEKEAQSEVHAFMVRSSILGLQDELERKLCEQRSLMITLNENWQKKIDELSTLRQELDTLSKYLFTLEPSSMFAHNNLESSEELDGTKMRDYIARKIFSNHQLPHTSNSDEDGTIFMDKSEMPDRATLKVADSPHFKSMTKEELVAYYGSEMAKLKRQHELALQEKTEELFSLKREIPKEKGSTPSHFRREKEIEHLRKKVSEFILKLDDSLLESEKVPSVHREQGILYDLKERMDTIFSEHQRLQALLRDQRNKVICLISLDSDPVYHTSFHSSEEPNLLEQIKKLKLSIEDVKIESIVRDEICKCVLRGLVGKYESEMDVLRMENIFLQNTYLNTYSEVVSNAISSINHIIVKCYGEKDRIAALLLEKEKALCSEVEENEKLKQLIESLSISINEKGKYASEASFTMMRQKEQFDLACQELNFLRDQAAKQEILISENQREFDSTSVRLDDTLQKVHCYEVEITKIKQNIKVLSEGLEEAEKQKALLHSIIQEKELTLSSAMSKEKEQMVRIKSIAFSMLELSNTITGCEGRMADNISRNASRVAIMNTKFNQIVQQANLLKKKGLCYKQIYQRRCSDLQKAEVEVDLLGDEVDALTKLLERIYRALDFYSPVLQHYPGVMEVLKLIRQELEE